MSRTVVKTADGLYKEVTKSEPPQATKLLDKLKARAKSMEAELKALAPKKKLDPPLEADAKLTRSIRKLISFRAEAKAIELQTKVIEADLQTALGNASAITSAAGNYTAEPYEASVQVRMPGVKHFIRAPK